MSDFNVGDLVACVDASRRGRPIPLPLIEGRHYRVTWVTDVTDYEGNYGLHVEGVNCPKVPGFHQAFAHTRFRKIDKADEGFSTWMKTMRPLKEAQQPYRIETPANA